MKIKNTLKIGLISICLAALLGASPSLIPTEIHPDATIIKIAGGRYGSRGTRRLIENENKPLIIAGGRHGGRGVRGLSEDHKKPLIIAKGRHGSRGVGGLMETQKDQGFIGA